MPFGLETAVTSTQLHRLGAPLRRALEDALAGAPLTDAAAARLIEVDAPEDLSALLAVAGHVRTRRTGTVVTYSPKVFLPVTNLCRDRCSYCTFRSDPDDAHAWTMLPEEIRRCTRQGRALGCIEALMCLGDKPEIAFRSYRATLQVLGMPVRSVMSVPPAPSRSRKGSCRIPMPDS